MPRSKTPALTLEDVKATFTACQPIFLALGDPLRQDIILLLAEQQRLNVNQIAEQLPLSRPAISHHLKVLKTAGLVQSQKEGTENYYTLSEAEALQWLKLLVQQVEVVCG